MNAELKPCPFCQGQAVMERVGSAKASCIVACENCGCRLETGEVWNSGGAWNRRPAEDALTSRVEELEARLGELLHAVCGETGFANAVRTVSGLAYPWPALDDAEARARLTLQGGDK